MGFEHLGMTLALALAASLTANAQPALAQSIPVGTATDPGSLAIGNNSQAGPSNSVAVGESAESTGGDSVAIGDSAKATAGRAIAIGQDTEASSEDATAVGARSKATATFATAIGAQAEAIGLQSSAYGFGSQATAESTVAIGDNSAASKYTALAIGSNSIADGTGAIAIGVLTQSSGEYSVAINGYAYKDSSTAIGNNATADAVNATAIGANSMADGENAIAIGLNSTASGTNSISIGTGNTVSGTGSGAFGDPNTVTGNGSYAFGNNNTIAQDNTFVLGNGVTTTQDNSVVLGNQSTDRDATTESTVTIGGVIYTFAGAGSVANGVVSVGSAGAERQIINVAAGALDDNSTDAVNGSQLHATNKQVTTNTDDIATNALNLLNLTNDINAGTIGLVRQVGGAPGTGALTFGAATGGSTVNFTGTDGARVLTGVAAGTLDASSTDAVNGAQLDATNQQVAANTAAITGNTNAISTLNTQVAGNTAAITSLNTQVAGNTTAIATLNTQVADNAADITTLSNDISQGRTGLVQQVGGAPGNGALTIGAATGGVSIDLTGTSGARTLSGVATGVAANDAVNVAQLAAAITNLSVSAGIRYDDATGASVTFNGGGASTALHNVAAGAVNAASTDAVNGSQLYATNQQVVSNTTAITALNNGTAGAFRSNNANGRPDPSNTGADSIAGGFGANASGVQSTALGNNASATGANSVALGYGSSDDGRSNVVSVGAVGAERQVTNVAAATRNTDAVNLGQMNAGLANTLQAANLYTDQSFANLNLELQNVNHDARSGVAAAMAVAGLPQAYGVGRSMVSGAVGFYQGESALAFGASRAFGDGKSVLKGGATYETRNGTVGANIGFGYQF